MQAKVTKSTIFYEQSKKYTAEGPPSSGLQPTKASSADSFSATESLLEKKFLQLFDRPHWQALFIFFFCSEVQ